MQIHVFVKTEHQQSGCSFSVALRPVTRFRSSLASLAGPNEGISHPPGMKFHPESVMAFTVNCHSGGNRVTPPRNTCRLSSPLPGSKHLGIMTLIDKRLVRQSPHRLLNYCPYISLHNVQSHSCTLRHSGFCQVAIGPSLPSTTTRSPTNNGLRVSFREDIQLGNRKH